jgi:hypothetical protein
MVLLEEAVVELVVTIHQWLELLVQVHFLVIFLVELVAVALEVLVVLVAEDLEAAEAAVEVVLETVELEAAVK